MTAWEGATVSFLSLRVRVCVSTSGPRLFGSQNKIGPGPCLNTIKDSTQFMSPLNDQLLKVQA